MNVLQAVGEHYALYLGKPVVSGTVEVPQQPDSPSHYQLNVYRDMPCPNAATFATLGLSAFPSHTFKEELIFLCYERFLTPDFMDLIAMIAEEIIKSKHPLYRGQCLHLHDTVIKNTTLTALYCCPPVYFPESFHNIHRDNIAVGILWLVPIHRSEADWLNEHGWDAFESRLQELDPDLMDLSRSPLKL